MSRGDFLFSSSPAHRRAPAPLKDAAEVKSNVKRERDPVSNAQAPGLTAEL